MKKLDSHIDIRILEKAKILQMITEYLNKYSSSESICCACNLEDGVLTLGSTDSSSLSVLRNFQRDIQKDINSEFNRFIGKKIYKIKLKIIQNPTV
tara:strand:- start:727 stop:1014 length:288 start_codon:yes stop_codon:yes gene_type:complete